MKLLLILLIFQVNALCGRSMYERFKKIEFLDYIDNQPRLITGRGINFIDYGDYHRDDDNEKAKLFDNQQKMQVLFNMFLKRFNDNDISNEKRNSKKNKSYWNFFRFGEKFYQ